MPFKLRTVESLAEELGSQAEAAKQLKAAGAAVIFGMFDQGTLDAFAAEPRTSNIGKKARVLWTLSPTDGIGAVKHTLDELDLDIVRHLQHRANYITVRNSKGQRVQLKMHTANRKHTRTGNASFTVTGYLREAASQYFLLMCYDGPVAWAISRQGIMTLHKSAVKAGGDASPAHIAKADLDDLNGRMRVTLGPDSDMLLKSAKQIGL